MTEIKPALGQKLELAAFKTQRDWDNEKDLVIPLLAFGAALNSCLVGFLYHNDPVEAILGGLGVVVIQYKEARRAMTAYLGH